MTQQAQRADFGSAWARYMEIISAYADGLLEGRHGKDADAAFGGLLAEMEQLSGWTCSELCAEAQAKDGVR